MKNQHPDSKILLIRSNFLTRKNFICLFGFLVLLFSIQFSYAEVFIPVEEYVGFYDSGGIYTVVGNVKNELEFSIVPTITVSVKDDLTSKSYSETIKHVPLSPNAEIPFKIKFPEILGSNPILLPAELSFEKTIQSTVPIAVLYDETLIQYDDGHLTGRIQNTGDKVIYYPKIFAVVHGHEKVLDITQNIEFIEKISPGEIVEFSMYPDPSITDDIFYYSCFAPVDTTVIPITAKKNNGEFDFRYDSGAWYSAAKFDDQGTTLSVRGYNSYPLETYANFEFPPISGDEKFDVTLNDQPIEFIQSMDEMGFWHVAFSVAPTSQGIIKISGFEQGLPPDMPKIPQWIKLNAEWWSTNQISDLEFLEGIDFLLEKEIISLPPRDNLNQSQWEIPQWVKTSAEWWFTDKITDEEFLNLIQSLIKQKILII